MAGEAGAGAPPAAAAPSAPPVAAPAAAAPSSAPVVPASPAAAPAQAPAAVPAVVPPAGQPGAPAAVPAAAPAAPASAEPSSKNYPNNHDGQQRFLQDHHKWRREAGAPQTAEEQAAAAAKDGPLPGMAEEAGAAPAEAAKPAEAAAPPEPGAAEPAKPAVAETPQAMAKLLEGKPERKAFLDGDPEFKAAVFETSRQMAEAKPILDMVPTVDDARFMQENTAAMVGMRRSAMLAVEDTSSLPQFFEQFDSQFAVVDKDGNPVLDAAGKPSYAADREIIVGGLVGREMERVSAELTPQIEQLKRQLATGVYPNEAAKAMAQKQLEDMEWGAQLIGLLPAVLDGSFLKQVAPEIPGDASAEFKTWAEGERKRIDEDNAKLDEKKRDTGKETRKTERAQFESSIRGESARGAGDIIGTALKAEMDGGVYIPEFYLQEKWRDPATGQDSNTSALAMKVFTQFEKQLRQPGSRTLMTITEHELLPRTPQTKEMRSTWYRQQAAKIIPGLVKAEVERIQQLVQVDQDKLAGQHRQRQQVAQPEPNSGSSSLPQGLTENQLTTRAEELASKRPDWAGANRGERQALILTERKRIQRSGAK